MLKNKQIYFFLGTSAELIKLAPIIRELQMRKVKYKVISSGQNRINFEDLTGLIGLIKPDIAFKEKINRSSVFHFLFWTVKTLLISAVLLRKEFRGLKKRDLYFVIHGDTVSSSVGALIAKLYRIKLVHVESGDLSSNLFEPFPEEICRNINIRLADILFSPNKWAMSNLKDVRGVKINTRQNTLLESFVWAIKHKLIKKNLLKNKRYYILIMHRQENVIFKKDWSRKTLEFIVKNADPSLDCLVLNHPLTIKIIKFLDSTVDKKTKDRITPISRLPYPDFMKLMKKAAFIATDGCTNQLESYYLGLPCLALRNVTEQIEGLNKNVVIAKGDERIMKEFLNNYKKYRTRPVDFKIRPSKIIVDYLLQN